MQCFNVLLFCAMLCVLSPFTNKMYINSKFIFPLSNIHSIFVPPGYWHNDWGPAAALHLCILHFLCPALYPVSHVKWVHIYKWINPFICSFVNKKSYSFSFNLFCSLLFLQWSLTVNSITNSYIRPLQYFMSCMLHEIAWQTAITTAWLSVTSITKKCLANRIFV